MGGGGEAERGEYRDRTEGHGVSGLGPSSRPPRGGRLGPSHPLSPKCPTIQMASIPEVTPPGGGGSDKVTFPLFSPLPASQLPNTALFFLSVDFNKYVCEACSMPPALKLFSKPWLPHSERLKKGAVRVPDLFPKLVKPRGNAACT